MSILLKGAVNRNHSTLAKLKISIKEQPIILLSGEAENVCEYLSVVTLVQSIKFGKILQLHLIYFSTFLYNAT